MATSNRPTTSSTDAERSRRLERQTAHLGDAVCMMSWCLGTVDRAGAARDESWQLDWQRMGIAEAGLTHARTLIEFFVGRPRRKGAPSRNAGDLRPRDLLVGGEQDEVTWDEQFDSAVRHRVHADLDIIDKNLAHLSAARLDLLPSPWSDYGRLREDLLATAALFTARVGGRNQTTLRRFVLLARHDPPRAANSPLNPVVR